MDQKNLIDSIIIKLYKKDDYVFKEGDHSDDFMYFIFSGNLQISKIRGNEKEHSIGTMKDREFFGEMALLNRARRSSTIKVISPDAKLGLLDKNTLLSLGKTNPGFLYNLLKNSIERFIRAESKIATLVNIQDSSNTQKETIDENKTINENKSISEGNQAMNILDYINNLTTKFHKKGDIIFEENAFSDSKMYFVLSGAVRIVKDFQGHPKDIRIMEEGSFFGELALLSNQPRSAKAIVQSDDAKIGSLDQEQFIKIAKFNPSFLYTLLKGVLTRIAQAEKLIQEFSETP